MRLTPADAPAANDNERWSEEAYARLVQLSGEVLKAMLRRLSKDGSIEAREIAKIIRQVCNKAADPIAPVCPGTLTIENVALWLERDDRRP